MKNCRWCGETKPLDGFYVHPRMGDGHLNKCKECVRVAVRRRYHAQMQDEGWVLGERKRNRRRMRAKWRLDPSYRESRRGRARSPEHGPKRDARIAVGNAIRDGRLTAPASCEECGHDFSEFRRHAHHHDYTKLLDVHWLCSLCHGKRHRRDAA